MGEAAAGAERQARADAANLAKGNYVPHVIEPSAGVDRLALALLSNAYCEDQAPDEKGNLESRLVMRFHPRIAPVKVAVFPLLKNKPELVRKALEVRDLLRPHMAVFYDEAGAIGRRYRRQDEAGTPFGVTVDFETLGEQGPELKDTVTLRDRDTMKQQRVPIKDLLRHVAGEDQVMPPEQKAPAEIPAKVAVEPPLKKRAITLYGIIIFKLVKGLLCVALALVIYHEANKDISKDWADFLQKPIVTTIFEALKIHPENKFFTLVAQNIADLTKAKVHQAALGALLLSLFPLTEGIGMLFRVPWAGWLAIGESAFFVPIEVRHLVENFTWFVFGVTVVNIIIVWYLYAYREVLFHHHHRHHRHPPES